MEEQTDSGTDRWMNRWMAGHRGRTGRTSYYHWEGTCQNNRGNQGERERERETERGQREQEGWRKSVFPPGAGQFCPFYDIRGAMLAKQKQSSGIHHELGLERSCTSLAAVFLCSVQQRPHTVLQGFSHREVWD